MTFASGQFIYAAPHQYREHIAMARASKNVAIPTNNRMRTRREKTGSCSSRAKICSAVAVSLVLVLKMLRCRPINCRLNYDYYFLIIP